MFRALFLCCLVGVLWAIPAHAEPLQVSILLASGQAPVRFTLTEEDSRAFLSRWQALGEADTLVPLAPDSGYRGVLLRGARETEYRLYNGIGRVKGQAGTSSRRDDLRMLERWVLEHAPPPLGPSLLAALDQDVANGAGGAAFPVTHNRSAAALIEGCTSRAPTDARQRATCLHRFLLDRMDPTAYATALEKLLRTTDPGAP